MVVRITQSHALCTLYIYLDTRGMFAVVIEGIAAMAGIPVVFAAARLSLAQVPD